MLTISLYLDITTIPDHIDIMNITYSTYNYSIIHITHFKVITCFQFLSGFSFVAVENTGMEMKTKPTREITGLKILIYFSIEFIAPRLQKGS